MIIIAMDGRAGYGCCLVRSSAIHEPEPFSALVLGQVGDDPGDIYAWCRGQAPVFFSATLNAWVLTRHADVQRVFSDEASFGGPLPYGSQGGAAIHGRVLLHMSGEEHRKKSGLIGRRLRSPRQLRGGLREMVERTCAELLDALPAVADFKQGFSESLPLLVITRLIDVPATDQFRDWYKAISAAGGGNPRGDDEIFRRGFAARDKLRAFCEPLIAERRAAPGDDLLSDMCSMDYDGERMTDDEIKAFMSFLLIAGAETTGLALGNLIKQLLLHPEQWERLKAEPQLVASAAAEGIRFAPPLHASKRQAQVDLELHGARIERGDFVVAVMAAANRDPDAFAYPETFDVTRFRDDADRQFISAGGQNAFGGGRHFCIGSLLAKLELTSALSALLQRYGSLRLASGDAPDDVGWPLRGPSELPVAALRGSPDSIMEVVR
jgi:cytochrome P450